MSGNAEVRALTEEFPDWLIETGDDALGADWRAGRPLAVGCGGFVGIHAADAEVLRELLETAEHCDHRLALRRLGAELSERGVTVRTYVTNLIITRPDGRELLINCKRGTFRWAMGQDIGPIVDISGVVQDVVDAVQRSPS
ncbi:hypothetical protein [Actinomadura macra]|uniref:hypothetical protein n=1 Tax=Actinomadura macra TaxID=46164 RepID=UPI00082BFE2D|nr:hypothetical protein [Actinomadura macra]